jgi:D-sedoheptulose 7-phosphate isomerase
MAEHLIEARIRESLAAYQRLLEAEHVAEIARVASVIAEALKRGNIIILFGNGGSAADAQHIAAEFLGRYVLERRPMPAISLTDNTSTVTCIANDYAFERVFARQIEGFASDGDVAFGISTSGNSQNVVEAMEVARSLGLTTVAMTGESGGRLRRAVDHLIAVPSDETPRIQEGHKLVAHIICELVEREVAADG